MLSGYLESDYWLSMNSEKAMIINHRFSGTVAQNKSKTKEKKKNTAKNDIIVFICSLIRQKKRNKDATKSKLS